MKFLTTLTCTLITLNALSQSFEKVILPYEDPAFLYVNDSTSNQLYYEKLIPKENVIGAVVILPSAGESTQSVISQVTLPEKGLEKGIATLVPSINWGTDDRRLEVEVLNQMINQATEAHGIPKDKIFFCGLSNGGMIALRYAELVDADTTLTAITPAGVIGLDVPLDKVHLYQYAQREVERNFSEAGVQEAQWIIKNYETLYGGSPEEFPEKYQASSIYSHDDPLGGNAKFLLTTPLKMYTDLNVDWLLNQRHRDLYDWNGTDIVAMINRLKTMGHPNAEVVVSMNKGVRPDGTPHPHSWSILDTDDCLDWMIQIISD